jgi:hypothetical protein
VNSPSKAQSRSLRFTGRDIEASYRAWKCTCGPVALAVVFDLTLDEVRPLVGADYRGWMNPTQMEQAILRAGGQFSERDRSRLYRPTGPNQYGCPIMALHGITRIQFAGPWTAPMADPREAYRFTHWVASVPVGDGYSMACDNNYGFMNLGEFFRNMKELSSQVPRGSGEWWPTHVYEITVPEGTS